MLHATGKNAKDAILKVELDENLNLLKEEIILEFTSDYSYSKSKIVLNPSTGETICLLNSKSNDDKVVMKSIFLDKNWDLVSENLIPLNTPYVGQNGNYAVQLNSLFMVSKSIAIVNIENRIYYFDDGAFKTLDLGSTANLDTYLMLAKSDGGLVLIGTVIDAGVFEEPSLMILDLDKNLVQTAVHSVKLPNKIIANCDKQLASDFSNKNYGFVELSDAFIESDGKINAFVSSKSFKSSKLGMGTSNNLTLISLDENRKVTNILTVPTKSSLFHAYLKTPHNIKVIFEDSPKNYTKNGEYILNMKRENEIENSVLAVMNFDKLVNELTSRKLLKFSNNESEIKGVIVNSSKIDDKKDKIMLSIYRYGKKDMFIGELQ